MALFKVKGKIIEELPEVEVEANDMEEAQEKYKNLYEEDKIEGVSLEIDFSDDLEENSLIDNEGWDEMPRIVKGKDGKDYAQDVFGYKALDKCKIYNLDDKSLPQEVWDIIEYSLYYQSKGYGADSRGEFGTTNQNNLHYIKLKPAIFCIDCNEQLNEYDLEKVIEHNRCLKCQSEIWQKENKELSAQVEIIAREIINIKDFDDLKNIELQRRWVEEKYPKFKNRSKKIVTLARSLKQLSNSKLTD